MAIPRFAIVEAINRSATEESTSQQAWAGRPQTLTSSIRIGRCLIAEHNDARRQEFSVSQFQDRGGICR